MRFNLEFGHIYLDEKLSPQHKLGIKAALKLIKQLPRGAVVTTVLIDDYNPINKELNIDEYIKTLTNFGLRPDFVALESALVKRGRQVLNAAADSRLSRSYRRYIERHHKYPCSFLIAVWDLIRLGKISAPKNLFYKAYKPQKLFVADELYTVLPRYFESVENKSLELLGLTPWYENVARIRHLYLDEFDSFKTPVKKDIF